MADEYDVIIVGSGAGGGTLAHRLAPPGSGVLILERGDWLPREIENWDATAVFVDNRYVSADTWYDEDGDGLPAPGPLLRRRRHQVLRRRAVPAPRAGLRRAEAPRRDLARVAGRVRRLRAVLHPGRGALPGARDPRRGPDRAAGLGAVPLPAGVARAAHPAAVRRPRPRRPAPVPLAQRHHARRGRARLQHLHPLRDLRRVPVPGARQVRRRRDRRPSLAAAPERHAGPQRRRAPAGDRRVGPHGSRRSSPTSTARSSASPARSSWSPPARRTPPSCCSPAPTTGTRTGWPTGPTRSGATTCSTTAARSWRSRPRRTTPGSRRPSASTTTTSATTTSSTRMGNVQMVGKSSAPMYRGREAPADRAGADHGARRDGRARDRLLAVGRGPARPRQPGDAWPRTATSS